MACAQLDSIGEADRHKRFKSSGPQDAGPALFNQEPTPTVQQSISGAQHAIPAAAAEQRQVSTPGMPPPANTAARPNPLALPAASQQYPVLPQAAASAAAAAAVASALQAMPGAAQMGPDQQMYHLQANNSAISSAGTKTVQSLDPQQQQQQQQRRRAGPVNQWRPGMPLLTQQPAGAFTFVTPQLQQQLQQQQHSLAALGSAQHWSAQQQQQQQRMRPSGAGAGSTALQGGALAAALQNLLPLPGQLMALQQQQQQQQMSTAALLQKTAQVSAQQQQQQQRQAGSTGQPALQILQGIPTSFPSTTPVLVPSAPLASLSRALAASTAAAAAAEADTMFPPPRVQASTAAAAAAAAAVAAARISAAAAPAAAPGTAPSSSTGARNAGADLGLVGTPGWLKLLNCAVDPQGDSLALELLLGGQLYKGQLTRVTAGQPAAAAAGTGWEQQQQQQQQRGASQGLSEADTAALLEFAHQREGICFLCALPFTKNNGSPSPTAAAAAAGHGPAPAAALTAAAVNSEAGATEQPDTAAVAADQPGSGVQGAMADPPAAVPAVQEQLALGQPMQNEQQQQDQAAPEQQKEQTAPAQPQQQQPQQQQQQQGDMMGSLGPAMQVNLGDGCHLMLHQACAEAAAKAAGFGQQHQQQLPSVQQLLACLDSHCCACDQRAPTLQCAAPGCSRVFHVPCIQGMGAAVLQDGSCWCSEHQDLMQQHQKQQQYYTAGPFAAASAAGMAESTAADGIIGIIGMGEGLSSPEPSKQAGINPSPSFAAALVLQQMRCSKGFDVLLVGSESQTVTAAAADSSSGAGSSGQAAAGRAASGATRSSAQRRLLEAMPVSNSSSGNGLLAPTTAWQYNSGATSQAQSHPAGLYGSTAEASRQYHLQQQQQGGYGAPAPATSAPGPATTLLLQRLQQQSGQASWQQQQQQVGPTRRSPKSAKGRPPLHSPSGKSKGGWNTLGLISAFALAQQQEETKLEQQQQQQMATSHAAAAAVAVSGPTVVVPRVRAKKGAIHHAGQY